MKRTQLQLRELLQFGEVAGVLLAWVIGVAILLTAEEPTTTPRDVDRLANAEAP